MSSYVRHGLAEAIALALGTNASRPTTRAPGPCTALAIEPAHAKALYRRGTARLRLGHPAEAAADLEAAAASTPADKEIQRLLAEARAAGGRRAAWVARGIGQSIFRERRSSSLARW